MTRKKRKTPRRINKNTSSKRDRNKNPKESQIRIIKDDGSVKNRDEQRRRKRKKRVDKRVYRQRRIGLAIAAIIIIGLPLYFIIGKLNSYSKMGYPGFRDEVLDDLSKEVFISSTEGRSLTSAEKSSDFDTLTETIIKNFAVDQMNTESFKEFVEKSNDYKKKISNSKTDQDFFLLVNEYLEILDDSYTKILDKATYDDLFDYYKNKCNSNIKNILENPQVVNRYKRIIKDKNELEASIGIENGLVLRVTLPNFKIKDLDKIKDEIIKAVTANPGVTTIIVDLQDNNSVNNLFVNEFAKYFIHQDYSTDDIFFYRGHIFEKTLEDIKNDDNGIYKTSFVKNIATRFQETPDHFDPNNYAYYDQISQKISKDNTFANRRIFVLTNANTANEAIKLASIFKESGAYLVKNALDPNPNKNDRIYEPKPSFFALEHSGLVISINAAKSQSENLYIDYNQRINSKYPISSVLSIIG